MAPGGARLAMGRRRDRRTLPSPWIVRGQFAFASTTAKSVTCCLHDDRSSLWAWTLRRRVTEVLGRLTGFNRWRRLSALLRSRLAAAPHRAHGLHHNLSQAPAERRPSRSRSRSAVVFHRCPRIDPPVHLTLTGTVLTVHRLRVEDPPLLKASPAEHCVRGLT